MTTIEDLVNYALLSTTNEKKEIIIDVVPAFQAEIIEKLIGINVLGCKRVIDNYMRHTIGQHGSPTLEIKRGQIAITTDDFQKIPMILADPDSIELIGKNNLKQNLIRYTKRIDELYMIVEAVRIAKWGNKMVYTTMYKRK